MNFAPPPPHGPRSNGVFARNFKKYGIRAGQITGGCVYLFHGHSLTFSVVGILPVYLVFNR